MAVTTRVVLLLAAVTASACTAHGPAPTTVEPTVMLVADHAARCPAHPPTDRATGTVKPPQPPRHAGRIAPPLTPTSLTICRYDGLPGRLTGERSVERGLDAVPDDLAWLPLHVPGASYACAASYEPHFGYLLHLRYPGGSLWIGGDTESCTGATNGTVSSDFAPGRDVEHAYATGAWVNGERDAADVEPDACNVGPTGRLGQEHAMVPGTPTLLTLCRPGGHAVTTTNFARLLRLLDSRDTSPTSSSCQPDDESAEIAAYEARFSYAQGPPVVVNITSNCEPKLSNRSLDANDDGSAWREADGVYRAG